MQPGTLPKNLVAAGVAEEVLVQLAYAIGVSEPVSINVNTYGTSKVAESDAEIAEKIGELISFKPAAIVKRFGLKNPIFSPTAAYGHMGRDAYEQEVEVSYVELKDDNGVKTEVRTTEHKKMTFFSWEKLDLVEQLKPLFSFQ
jgi:S-adenosylmethionine synthetase